MVKIHYFGTATHSLDLSESFLAETPCHVRNGRGTSCVKHVATFDAGSVQRLIRDGTASTHSNGMENKITEPLSYAADADPSVLEEIARLDGLRVRN